MSRIFIGWLFIFSFFTSLNALSQQENTQRERLKVFIDCINTRCDMNFIKTEINIVDFLLDPLSADVHIQVTSHNTGGGGYQYQMIFYGQNRFNTLLDTVTYYAKANSTEMESRDLLLQHLKLGLVPFITKTGLVSGHSLSMKQEANSEKQTAGPAGKKDPWNYWVMTLSADGNVSSEQAYKSFGYNGNFTASRITEKMKAGFSVYGSNSSTSYIFETDTSSEKFIAKNSNYGLEHYFVKSISDHWSAGYELINNNNTFSNFKRQLYFRSAVEYDIFPYQEVNNRFLTLSYSIITRFNRYYDTTLYDKLKETLLAQSFRATLILNKKWGTINS
ncbi:MAG TPA: hypothetical protein VET23_03425, partial [Chitinophagaceae bacterium]|nr:hypothetical protein [Chitinophagaceae bacterium]